MGGKNPAFDVPLSGFKTKDGLREIKTPNKLRNGIYPVDKAGKNSISTEGSLHVVQGITKRQLFSTAFCGRRTRWYKRPQNSIRAPGKATLTELLPAHMLSMCVFCTNRLPRSLISACPENKSLCWVPAAGRSPAHHSHGQHTEVNRLKNPI